MAVSYQGLVFRTRLEATWAAFFDLAGWDWAPDFRVSFACDHSECGPRHALLVAVLDVDDADAFRNHPSQRHNYGLSDAHATEAERLMHVGVDAGAGFGRSPAATVWQFAHGGGGGIESVDQWVPDAAALWARAQTSAG